jgi:hypothetical protein
MRDWEKKGCESCRRKWETGQQPRRLGMSDERQAYLHYCDECSTYWEQFERYADVISLEDVVRYYPGLLVR